MSLVRAKTILLFVTVCAVISMVITTTNFAGRSTSEEGVPPIQISNLSSGVIHGNEKQTNEGSSNIQVVLLALRPEGFEPAEMQLPQGNYLFVVKNRTGLDEVNVRLVNENSQQILTAKVGSRGRDLKHRIEVAPGTYRLSETDHPDWTCTIVVTR
jgi:hypothetical protein